MNSVRGLARDPVASPYGLGGATSNGMNVSISQALATGMPVITTKHSGLKEQVVDGYNGLLVDEGDWQALAEKIVYMIKHPELWPEFGKNGREHVQKNYNDSILIDKQIEYYQEGLNSNET